MRFRSSLSGIGVAPAAALCVLLALAACKDDSGRAGATPGGPSAAAAADAPPRAVLPGTDGPPDTRPVIVCFGDSLTAGYGTDPGESYPDGLQKLLDRQGYRYRVVNAGVSGETTKDGLERVARVIAQRPRLVVLEFGGNDGLRGLPMEQTQANLSQMIERLQQGGVTVALAGISLPPEYGPEYRAKIEAIYPALAKQYHLRLLPFLLKDVYGVPGDMQEDGHHATAKGNLQVAANVDGLLRPLLKR